jgi:hypothetical protein
MERRSGGIGVIVLVVVVAVVLVLVAQAWKSVAPAALDLERATSGGPVHAHGQEDAAQELRSGELPKLTDMAERTADHSAGVQDALAGTE